MLDAASLSLDHFGVILQDLPTAAQRWERLGFLLTPQTQQVGAVPGSTGPQPWATANRCVMLEQGYMELMGVTDATRHFPLQHLARRYEGIHLIALRCGDADAAYRALLRRAAAVGPPVQRMRWIPDGHKESQLRFKVISSDDTQFPEGRFFAIEHQTPDLLWQRRFMQHPNGARRLLGVAIVAADVSSSAARIAAFTGATPVPRGDQVQEFQVPGGGNVSLFPADVFASRYPGSVPPVLPAFAGASVAFADRSMAQRLIARNGIKVHESPDATPWIHAADTNGFVLWLEQA